ncbi:MAG: hypothetical protein WCI45_05760, partial [Desulfuromonadales bacterium]
EAALTWLDGNTPVVIVIGTQDRDLLTLSAKILLRYTKAEPGSDCRIELRLNDLKEVFSVVNDMNPESVETYLVSL